MDNRRKFLIAIIATFMVVTVPHVAIYAGSFEPSSSFWLGWPYALAVEASIIACAYFTKWQMTRIVAWLGYFCFVIASGIMNVGYIKPETFPAWTYALFPTTATALLGFLYRQVDKLVQAKESQQKPAKANSELAKAEVELTPSQLLKYSCQNCQQMFGSQSALNAHQKKHSREILAVAEINGNGHK